MKDKFAKLSGHADELLNVLFSVKWQYYFLEAMIDNEHFLSNILDDSVLAFSVLRQKLYFTFIHDIATVCFDEKQGKSLGLVKIINTLLDVEMKAFLREKYSSNCKIDSCGYFAECIVDNNRIEDYLYNERIREFDEKYTWLIKEWCCFVDKYRKKFRLIRDKVTAHKELEFNDGVYLPVDVKKHSIPWGEVKQSVQELQEIVDCVRALVCNSSFQWDSFDDPAKRSVASFLRVI